MWSKNLSTQFWNFSHFFWNLFSFLSSDLSLEEDLDLEDEPEEEEPEEEPLEELEEEPLFNIGLYPPPVPVPAYARIVPCAKADSPPTIFAWELVT